MPTGHFHRSRPSGGRGAWGTSGHILGTAQGRFRTGPWWRLGVQAELLCSEPYGKFEQGLSKQHGSLLGICNWDSLNVMWSQQVRSTLAENLKQRGKVKERKEGDTGAYVTRMRHLLNTTGKGTLEGKVVTPNPEAVYPCSSGTCPPGKSEAVHQMLLPSQVQRPEKTTHKPFPRRVTHSVTQTSGITRNRETDVSV